VASSAPPAASSPRKGATARATRPDAGKRGKSNTPLRLTPSQSLTRVRERLQWYADRGVFRRFSELGPLGDRYRFRFSWLGTAPLALDYSPENGTFTFRSLLPHVPARSALFEEIQTFVVGRGSPRLPPHRRVDRRRARIRCLPARGTVSVELVATRNHHEYGVNRVVNLVHEVFLYLHEYQPEYMWAHLDSPEE